MSGGKVCRCPESRKPIRERRWRVVQYRQNHSAFNGYAETPSDYSTVVCDGEGCPGTWRTKAAYVDKLAAAEADKGAGLGTDDLTDRG